MLQVVQKMKETVIPQTLAPLIVNDFEQTLDNNGELSQRQGAFVQFLTTLQELFHRFRFYIHCMLSVNFLEN